LAEIQRYQVLETNAGFEVRDYEPHTIVTKPIAGDMGSASYSAFGYLAGYIGGENEAGQKIAMTAPVLQQKRGSGFDVSFVMPHNLKNAPNPVRSGMRVEKVEGKLMAAKRFSGGASDALFERKSQELIAQAGRAGYRVIGEVLYARYNGPWTPPILRRNEVLVEIERN
jgi:cystathionine beta-lyase family protein involved in aluminum resistance